MPDTPTSEYKTIEAPAGGLLREKMSKFISFAVPVRSAAQAREEIARIANEYHDARHVCWAYMLGADMNEFMSNDNGEPSGTAGKPILGQIRSAGLTNIAIAVVRYFGGIKLGTSGLIAAYREAARLAIENAHIVTRYEKASISFTFPYQAMNDVMRVMKNPDIEITERRFDNTCAMTIETRTDRAEEIGLTLSAIDGVTLH